jgi:hypothetical protein
MIARLRLPALCLAAVLVSAGCAGGGGVPSSGLMPPGNGSGIGGAQSGAVVRVRVPWSGAPIGTRSGAISQAATLLPPAPAATVPTPSPGATAGAVTGPRVQALTLTVAGSPPTTATIGLTPTAPGCTPLPPATLLCQAVLALPPGTYTASAALYASNAPTPSVEVGSPQAIAFAVAPGGTVVNLALSTVPASVTLAPGGATASQSAQGGITLYGAGKHALVAQMLDANDNVILTGSMPTFTVTQISGALTLSFPQPSATALPNTFTVSPPAGFSATSSATLQISASAGASGNPCMQSGAVCTASVPVNARQLLAVANSSANSVTLYPDGQALPLATLSGAIDPQALVFDALGDLFVTSQPGSVVEYLPPYTGTQQTIGAGINHPQALAIDARGNLFVANGNGSNSVNEYAPPYTGGPTESIVSGIDDPVSLGVDGTGNLFVVNAASNTVTQYAPPYTGAPVTISNGLSGPSSLAVDAHGDLFVANLTSTPNSVVEYVPPFSSHSVPAATIVNGINEQGAIEVSGSAALFVPNQGSNSVTRYVVPYTGSPAVISGGQSQPVALALDSLGNLFVANYGNNTVTEYSPPYTGGSWSTISNGISNPQALALSPASAPNGAVLP